MTVHTLLHPLCCSLATMCLLTPVLQAQDTTLALKSRRALTFANAQIVRTAKEFRDQPLFPRSTNPDGSWHAEKAEQWTSGFFPGLLWMQYGETSSTSLRGLAESYTGRLEHMKIYAKTHDIGFVIFSSFGRGYRLTGNERYREVILQAASTLASRYSPTVGAIKSWDNRAWAFPVIIDNMMNLEMLLWAAGHGGDPSLRDIAISHARRTRENHVRADGSTYHVVSYDTATGAVLERVTHQGAFDESCWSRGQAWALYGFTMVYRYTDEKEFLSTAERCADYFLDHLPPDGVPYWDAQAPGIPNALRDASAGAIAASGLLELSQRSTDVKRQFRYLKAAEWILGTLAAPPYLAVGSSSHGILNHAVGHMPKNSEVDVSLVYGDYYFVEALLRYKRILEDDLFKDVLRLDVDRIMVEARRALDIGPVTITAFPAERSAGGVHDFYSEGDYWWPDPEHPDGPYIRRDGLTNPENFTRHREAMISMADAVSTLTAAYIITNEQQYADHALRHLRAWFVDEKTRMNPSLFYAQAIYKRVTGRGIGIIDTIHLIDVALASRLLSASPDVDPRDLESVRGWFAEYLAWLTHYQYGLDEMNAKNNHGTWWVAQASAFALATGDTAVQRFCADRFREVLLPNQMAVNGSSPLELERTKPYNYSLFNLEGMAVITHLLSNPDRDLWTFTLPDGRSMVKGMTFMSQYVPDKSSWPFPKDAMYFDEYPGRHSSFLLAAAGTGSRRMLNIWEQLDPIPGNAEVRRSLPIVQPLLWVLPRTTPW